MTRRFLTLRWVTITFLTVAIMIIFVLFGRWQLHRWESRGTHIAPPDARPPVELTTLVSPDAPLPGGSIGRQATVRGSFDGTHQVLVPRDQNGRAGFWVVTPLRITGSGTDGAAAMVVRGWVPTTTDPALSAPRSPVSITGRLYASEDPPPVGSTPDQPLPAGQFREVNTAELTGHFPYRILDGYLLLADSSPGANPAPAVVPVPLNEVNSGGGLRNLAYAIQWWLFALAVLYFYVKLIRDDLASEDERPAELRSGGAVAARAPEPRSSAGTAPSSTAAGPSPGTEEPEDAELAAYNRYLAELNARSSSRSARS